MSNIQQVRLEKDFFIIDITVVNAEIISLIEVHPNVATDNYNNIDDSGFFAGSCIHNPSRMAINIEKHFVDKLSVQEHDKAYENNNARFAVIAIHDQKITLFFNESNNKQNKFLHNILTEPEKHNIKDIWVVFLEKL